MPRILIVGSHCEQMLNFRGDLIRHLQSRGHEVLAASPPGAPDVDRRFASWGVRRIDLAMDRAGVSIVHDLRLLMQLRRLISRERPDLVLAYTIKPVIYGALAARWAGRPVMVAMVTGLGLAFSEAAGPKQRLVRALAQMLYRLAMPCIDVVVFQNRDDEVDFRRHRLLGDGHRVEHTAGSGVNLQRFPLTPLPPGPLRFVMITRLLADKGVREYIAAAAELRRRYPSVECHLVGPRDPNPASLSEAEVGAAVADGSIVYTGFTRDVRPHLMNSHVFVLPSYREGTPRSVLEALAVGRPVITTDAPGCRETVVNGENGTLVPPRSVPPLVEAMCRMVEMDPQELLRMAQASHSLAATRFDVVRVNEALTTVIERAIADGVRSASASRAAL
ncbi:MAG: glycosyltransferase family 4 protein [Piscinibacter sp.]|nr:glycosyltransferase family 4 protein [Piscinibacter sp.]